jgi:hypothetical protein
VYSTGRNYRTPPKLAVVKTTSTIGLWNIFHKRLMITSISEFSHSNQSFTLSPYCCVLSGEATNTNCIAKIEAKQVKTLPSRYKELYRNVALFSSDFTDCCEKSNQVCLSSTGDIIISLKYNIAEVVLSNNHSLNLFRSCCGRDHMIAGFTTIYVMSGYHRHRQNDTHADESSSFG